MASRCVRRTLIGGALSGLLVAAGTLSAVPAVSAPLTPLSPSLVAQLNDGVVGSTPVMVHGATLDDARNAVAATGMSTVTSFDKIGVVVARGTASQIEAARTEPGVTYLEGNTPIEFFTNTSHKSTRGAEAWDTLRGANGAKLDGTGVSIAIIDSGIDPTHPAFNGGKVVANLRSTCLLDDSDTSCIQRVPNYVDTDTTAVGGHGTHVSGIASGNQVRLTDGTPTSGAAPGSKIVSISTGAVLFIIGADSALNWVLENHRAPCGPGVSPGVCPPIKVTNNSYGPSGGGAFDPNSATVKLQRALAREGVVTVWAAGNDGGDGSESLTNPPGQDPTGGIISVASYYDQATGTRNGTVSDFSSRGLSTNSRTWPDISAPGEDIVSACRPYLVICSTGRTPQNGPAATDIGTYNTISGTSMAAPHIAGIVAQLFQACPTATPAQIERALVSTAYRYTNGSPYRTVNGVPTSFDKGAGLVDVVRAAKSLGARPR